MLFQKLTIVGSSEKTCFVQCDISSWDDQVRLFEAAVTKSPSKTVDIVISNAGVGRGAGDPMMALEGMVTAIDMTAP
jgi:NAD(P)-dependent dehydrogenase (short-subunit alcohol dehydrogenase family)